MTIEKEMRRKKSEPPPIKTLDKRVQAVRHAYGFYDFDDGSIELGCEEQFASQAIWHESMHMLFFEQFFFEACVMWDNIAHELQEFLFDDCCIPENPFIFTLPEPRAKPIDNGWYCGRKQKEKSERTGYKPSNYKRVPIRVNRG